MTIINNIIHINKVFDILLYNTQMASLALVTAEGTMLRVATMVLRPKTGQSRKKTTTSPCD